MRFSTTTWLAAGAGLLLSTACGENEVPPGSIEGEWTATYDTIGDTIVVRTVSGSLWGRPMHLEERVSIGEVDGPEEYTLGSVRALAVAEDGTIYVLDRQVPAVRAYAPDGTYLRTLGRIGSGPGEYSRPEAMALGPQGNLFLRDPANGRILVLSPSGDEVAVHRIPTGFSSSSPLYIDREGAVYHSHVRNLGAPPGEWIYGYARFGSDGSAGDTLVPPQSPQDEAVLTAATETSATAYPLPYSGNETVHITPWATVAWTNSSRYAVEVGKADGAVLRIEREYEPVPVLPGEAEQHRERIVRNLRNVDPNWRWNGPPIPQFKPPFSTFFLGADGSIWTVVNQTGVEIENPGFDPDDPTSPATVWVERPALDAFDSEGRFRGRVTLPEEFSPTFPLPYVRGDTLWGVTRDSLGVQRVVRFEVVPAPEESGG